MTRSSPIDQVSKKCTNHKESKSHQSGIPNSASHFEISSLLSCRLTHYTLHVRIIFSDLKLENMGQAKALKVRDITFQDFQESLKRIRRSVPASAIDIFDKWNAEYGDISC